MSPRTLSLISAALVFFVCDSECIAEEPSLDDLLKQYKALGLPLPPKEAKLVRFEYRDEGFSIGRLHPKEGFGVGFLLKPETDKEVAVVLMGTEQRRLDRKSHLQEVKPDAKVGELPEWLQSLPMAFQCHERGWDELARSLIKQSNENHRMPRWSPFEGKPERITEPIRTQLIKLGWSYWRGQVTEPDIDRAPVAKRLHQIIKLDKEIATNDDLAMLKSLDAALVPSKAKPGSVAALIDDLVDYCPDELDRDKRCDRIAILGFEAVPELIAHLDDDRLTRQLICSGGSSILSSITCRWTRVGDVASALLMGLTELPYNEDVRLKKADVQKWWESAQKLGEEAYLVQHVWPPMDQRGQDLVFVNCGIVAVIGHKYPKRLPSIYREILKKRPDNNSAELSNIVMTAAIPLQEKVELLTIQAKHKDWDLRNCGLFNLSKLDKNLFSKLLTAAIEELPRDLAELYYDCDEVRVAHLVMETDDLRPWQALEKAARRSTLGLKMELLHFGDFSTDVRHRSKRLRLLMPYLDDATVRDANSDKRFRGSDAGSAYQKIEVRNFAALEIASLVDIEVKLDLARSPEDWAKIRNQVREAAERELAKEKNQ